MLLIRMAREFLKMSIALIIAGTLSAICFGLHVFMGGREVAAPLLAARDLGKRAKYVQYYCWHLVSISLFLMSVLFFWPALFGRAGDLARLGSVMAALFAGWGILLPPMMRQAALTYRDLPQGWLFVPIAVVGFWGSF